MARIKVFKEFATTNQIMNDYGVYLYRTLTSRAYFDMQQLLLTV
ncbi:MAG: hypothetical protein ACSNEK_08315 [Parachlamydiaceae bacterium]